MANESRSRSEEEEEEEEEEIKIAVLSVHKKGSILKRIFLNCPPPPRPIGSDADPIDRGGGRGGEEDGRPILFGRHPDCHVVVDHPSISRFHLAVRLVPSEQKLSVTDLSSVHGTWVSGTRIPPNSAIEMVDGETLRLGASTRVYMLQWVSSSRVLEMENPLEPVVEDKVEALQDDSGGLAPDVNQLWPTVIPSAPPLPESMNTSPLPLEREPQIPVGKAPEVDNSSTISDASIVESTAYSMPTMVADSSPQVSSVIKQPTEQEYLNPESAEKRSSPSSLLSVKISQHSPELVSPPALPSEPQSPTRKAQEVESSSSISAAPIGESIGSSMPSVIEESSPQVLSAVREPSQQEPLSLERSEKRNVPSSLLSRRSKSKPIGFLRIDTGRDKENVADSRPEIETEQGVEKEKDTACAAKSEETLCRVLTESFDNVGGKEQHREECFESDKENVTPVSDRQKINRSSRVLQKSVCVAEHSDVSANDLCPSTEDTKKPIFKSLIASSVAEGNLGSDQEICRLSISAAKNRQKTIQQLHCSYFSASSMSEEDGLHVDKENWVSDSCKDMESREAISGTLAKVEDNVVAKNVLEDVLRINKENWIPDSCKDVKSREVMSAIVAKFEDNAAAPSVSEAVLHIDKENFTLPKVEDNVAAASSLLENVLHIDKENRTPGSGEYVKSRKVMNGTLDDEDVLRITKENWIPDFCKDVKSREVMSATVAKFEDNAAAPSVSEAVLHIDKENFTLPKVEDNVAAASSLLENVLHIDKENRTPDSGEYVKSRKVMNGTLDDEDACLSNKENLTPQVSRSLKSQEFLIPSNNHERIEKEIMKKKAERIPFQALLEMPSSKTACAIDQKNSSMGNCAPIKDDLPTRCEPNRSSRSSTSEVFHKAAEESAAVWNMVVDANCFLDEESRKSLLLLEGLKGTRLIIPRIVIRELDCLKRRESFFSKSTKMASKALQWIEECMINTSWWIHVQGSFETPPVAPTPPISPQSSYADSIDSKSFSTYGSLTEIVSPTAEDHILDCALLFKQIKAGAKFILLSNSVTLKIKAMAEGLLCETPKEFRESLVNPFSKRFLWADSSPRGSTWSCSNDLNPLHEYLLPHQPARKVGKVAEAAKGLKLILLHNSQYGQINSIK